MIHPIRSNRFVPTLTALSLGLATAVASTGAHASAFQLTENSAQSIGRAEAGGPAGPDDCASIVNNPAAMSDFKVTCLAATGSMINAHIKFAGGGADAFGSPLTGGNGGNGGSTQPLPATFIIRPINDQLTLGFATSVPFGLKTQYDDRWVGRYQSVETKLGSPSSPTLTFAGSWKFSDELSLGASFIAQRETAVLSQDINIGTILAAPTNGAILPQEADGQGTLKGSSWGYGFGLGLLWMPTPADRIGVNFHSQIDQTIKGNATFLIPSNLLPLFGGAFTNTKGSADFTTPAFVNLGWWHKLDDRFSFGINASYTDWSSFKTLQINYANPLQAAYNAPDVFNYKSSWFGSIGGEYRMDDQWTLRAGIAYDQTPTTNATRDPKVPDGSRKWVALGAGYKYNENLQFDAGFVHLFVNDSTVNDLSPTFDTLNGTFKLYGNVLTVSARYTF